jgi:hypothetical protein
VARDAPLYATTRLPQLQFKRLFSICLSALATQHNARMSDFEDEMDVDAPAANDAVVFSSDISKGKRSAANLPVEAEDSLPWYEDDLLLIDLADSSQG